jgi:hypothetical protein
LAGHPANALTAQADQLGDTAVDERHEMNLFKILPALLTALVAMALIGTASAGATGVTALCKEEEKVCKESSLAPSLHLFNTEGSVLRLLNSIANILCLEALVATTSLQVGVPQKFNSNSITFQGCGISGTHTTCTVGIEELPAFTLLRTEENLGVLTVGKASLLVKCEIFKILKVDCTYETSGLEFAVEGALHTAEAGAGMVTAAEVPIYPEEESELCPKKTTIDFLLEPLEYSYVSGVGDQSTALCEIHEDPCESENLVTSIETFTEEPLLKVKYSGNEYPIVCDKSEASASVGSLGTPQEIAVEELTWTNCEIIAGPACTIESIENGVLSLYKTGLNVGVASSTTNKIQADCPNPGFTCVFASEPKLRIEGANHTAGSGYGMFESNEPELENVEGDCEGPGFLYGLYEPLSSVYVVS